MGDTYDINAVRNMRAKANATTATAAWKAIDTYTSSHLDTSFPHLSHIKSDSDNADIPPIESNIQQAKLIAMQAYTNNVTHVLEIGTLGGLTSAWIAALNPGIKVTTIEADPRHAELAAKNLEKAGVASQVEILVSTGEEAMHALQRDVAEGKREKFGLVFIDADKKNNYTYLDLAVRMCHSRSSIYIDNCIPRDLGKEDAKEGELVGFERHLADMSRYARETIEKVGKDERVFGVVQQTVGATGYDGFLYAVVK